MKNQNVSPANETTSYNTVQGKKHGILLRDQLLSHFYDESNLDNWGHERDFELARRLMEMAQCDTLFSDLAWNRGCEFDGDLKLVSDRIQGGSKLISRTAIKLLSILDKIENTEYCDRHDRFWDRYFKVIEGIMNEWNFKVYPKDSVNFDSSQLELTDWLLIFYYSKQSQPYYQKSDLEVAKNIILLTINEKSNMFEVTPCKTGYNIRISEFVSYARVLIGNRSCKEIAIILEDIINHIQAIVKSEHHSKESLIERDRLTYKFWDIFKDFVNILALLALDEL